MYRDKRRRNINRERVMRSVGEQHGAVPAHHPGVRPRDARGVDPGGGAEPGGGGGGRAPAAREPGRGHRRAPRRTGHRPAAGGPAA